MTKHKQVIKGPAPFFWKDLRAMANNSSIASTLRALISYRLDCSESFKNVNWRVYDYMLNKE